MPESTMPNEGVRSYLMEASEYIAQGGPCPSCSQRWVRFSDCEELLHSETCKYITLTNQLEAALELIYAA